MEWFSNIIDTTLSSFDFGLVAVINIATYIVVKLIDEANGDKRISKNAKRAVLVICIIILCVIYHFIDGENDKLILNSAILAPVFWRWIGKPIVSKLGIDYKQG